MILEMDIAVPKEYLLFIFRENQKLTEYMPLLFTPSRIRMVSSFLYIFWKFWNLKVSRHIDSKVYKGRVINRNSAHNFFLFLICDQSYFEFEKFFIF